jgi:hypothetical protein
VSDNWRLVGALRKVEFKLLHLSRAAELGRQALRTRRTLYSELAPPKELKLKERDRQTPKRRPIPSEPVSPKPPLRPSLSRPALSRGFLAHSSQAVPKRSIAVRGMSLPSFGCYGDFPTLMSSYLHEILTV